VLIVDTIAEWKSFVVVRVSIGGVRSLIGRCKVMSDRRQIHNSSSLVIFHYSPAAAVPYLVAVYILRPRQLRQQQLGEQKVFHEVSLKTNLQPIFCNNSL
jgi:hypothetical protein